MDTLREVELLLSRVVAITQQQLLSSSARRSCNSPKVTAELTGILENIEKLQDTLKVSTREIFTHATQFSGTEAETSIKDERHDANLRLEGVQCSNSETETEDEIQDCEDREFGKKRPREQGGEPEAKRTMMQKENNTREKQLKKSVKNYEQIAREAAEMVSEEKKTIKQKMHKLETISSAAMKKMVKFIKDGGVPCADTATAFRDATILLPDIVARRHEQMSGVKKWIDMTIKAIRHVVELSKCNSKLPGPLSDPQLELTREALNHHSGVFCSDYIRRMEVFIKTTESKPNALEPDRIAVALEQLASDYHRDFRLYVPRQKSGKTAPRTEDRWAVFVKISEVLALWIHRAELVSPPLKLTKKLSNFDRQLRGFAKKYPGRVPVSLLRAAPIMTKLAQSKAQPNQSKKKAATIAKQ